MDKQEFRMNQYMNQRCNDRFSENFFVLAPLVCMSEIPLHEREIVIVVLLGYTHKLRIGSNTEEFKEWLHFF